MKVELSNDAKKLLKLRYCKPNEEPEEVYPRVAKALGEHDGYEKEFLEIMASKRFLPNSPALMNMGWNNMGKACFVLPIHDSMESIFQTLKDSAMVFQGGGGVGYNFSELRQEGSSLSSGGSSSGVMPFLELFNSLTEAVKSGGRRRGASMAILNADHPQILDFVKAKLTPRALSNFNLSVLVDNQFMDRVTTDEYIYLRDRKDKRRTVGKYKARDLFNIMTFAAYLTGDPGLMFYDRINRDNPFKEKIKSSNPCGEVCMFPYESCIAEGTLVRTLKGIRPIENVSEGDKVLSFSEEYSTPLYSEVIKNIPHGKQETIHFILENGMELSATQDHNILTIYGWKRVDHLNLSDFVAIAEYGTEDALESSMGFKLVTYITRPYNRNVYDLALTPIHNFVANGIIVHNCCLGSINLNEHLVDNDIDWSKFKETAEIGTQMLLSINKYSEYPVDECYKQNYKMNRIGLGLMGFADALMKMHIKYDSDETLELIDKITGCMFDVAKKKAPTSASVLSIAPTGSLSILASCSPSIEPIFSESYIRNLTFGTIEEIREKNEYLRTAHEVSPMWHLKIQAQFQKIIDNAVSKTCNLPHDATIQDIYDVYYNAWKMGCKGVTVFRDGSKGDQVMISKPTSKCDGETCYL